MTDMKTAAILAEVVKAARQMQADEGINFNWRGFVRVMFSTDEPLEDFAITREKYEEILGEAFEIVNAKTYGRDDPLYQAAKLFTSHFGGRQ